jgi:hypothetical protein
MPTTIMPLNKSGNQIVNFFFSMLCMRKNTAAKVTVKTTAKRKNVWKRCGSAAAHWEAAVATLRSGAKLWATVGRTIGQFAFAAVRQLVATAAALLHNGLRLKGVTLRNAARAQQNDVPSSRNADYPIKNAI